MELEQEKFHKVVDLDKIIADSDNTFLKSLPRFVINYMKKVLCQDELNDYHNRHKDKFGIDYINAMLSELGVKVIMHNEKLVSGIDRAVFVANHPLGGIDAMSYLSCINELKGTVVSPSNELFYYIPNLRPLIVSVSVFGVNTKDKIEAINQAFESDKQIMIFPAGIVSRKFKGVIKDTEWHKSFISKAVQTQRYVVPVFIDGNNSKKFYRISRIRKFFGIKLSIETFFLPQEMLKQRGKKVHIYFGNPIHPDYFDKTKTHHEWAQDVKNLVYEIGKSNLGK